MAMSITKDICSSLLGAKTVRRGNKELIRSPRGVRTLMNTLPLRRGLFLIPLVVACFALSSMAAQGQLSPAPDGGYPHANTAEGTDALFNLTTGFGNTANGFQALYNNTNGSSNTATGSVALYNNTASDNT